MTELSMPAGPDEVTPEWLTQALRSTGTISRAKIVASQSERLGVGQGFVGQVYRFTLEYGTPEDSSPRSLVAKLSSPDPDLRALTFALNQTELHFYQEIAPQVQLPTPRLYYGAVDPDSSKSILLLEDISNAKVGDNVAGCSTEEARLAFQQIGGFHAQWWDNTGVDGLSWLRPVSGLPLFDPESYQHRWGMFTEKFGGQLPTPLGEVAEEFGNHAGHIGDRLMGRRTTMIHGDYRLDNLFFGHLGTGSALTVFDWQVPAKGPGPVDIAYFTAFCLEPEHRRREEMDLLKGYHDCLVENGVREYEFDQCRQDYRLSMFFPMARLVTAGAILDFSSARGRSLISALIERVNAAVADHRLGELLA
ncbi:MAG: DUF1679 domain-containing protein [Chloroflexi bacterium]|nr:DUF1679 domain-containing protein [Chloroflexota bacterium]